MGQRGDDADRLKDVEKHISTIYSQINKINNAGESGKSQGPDPAVAIGKLETQLRDIAKHHQTLYDKVHTEEAERQRLSKFVLKDVPSELQVMSRSMDALGKAVDELKKNALSMADVKAAIKKEFEVLRKSIK